MTTITIPRALLEQTLEALEIAAAELDSPYTSETDEERVLCAAITALKAALTQEQAEPTRSQQMADAGFSRRPGLWAMQARAALELIAAPQRPDGTWNRDREACRQIAAEALGRYDDE